MSIVEKNAELFQIIQRGYGCKQIEIEKGEEGEAPAATTKPAKKYDGLCYSLLDHNHRLAFACWLPHLGFHQEMSRMYPFSLRSHKVIGTR